MSTPGPFEYYADKFKGQTGGTIRASTTAPESHALDLLALSVRLRQDGKRAGSHTEGSITGPVIGMVEPGREAAAGLARSGMLAVAVIRDFSGQVDVFDKAVDKANTEYQRLRGIAKAIEHDPDYRKPDYQGPEPQTWGASYAEVLPQYKTAEQALDEAADDVKSHLRHPSRRLLRDLFLSGDLTLEALALFPGVKLSGSDVRKAMAHQRPPALGTPLEILQTRLSWSRLSGIDPPEYKDLVLVYWQTKALERAGIDIGGWDLTLGADALTPIIEAVYNYYGGLYKQNPRMEWAGLANLVGPSFAGGFLDLAMMRGVLEKFQSKLPPGVPLGPFSRADVDKLASMGADEVKWYERMFLGMQQEIFLDMGSMNQAYVDGGMPAIKEMAAAGLFERTTNSQATQQMLNAWETVDDPGATSRELHTSAKSMAYREQHDIIQDEYHDMQSRPHTGEVVTKMFSTVGQVSVPGSRTMGEVDPTSDSVTVPVDANPWLPGPHVDVTTTVTMPIPQGNVADFEDRWTYFNADTLPAYTEMLDHPGQSGPTIPEVMEPDMGDRIEDYRGLNRIDDLAEVFAKGTKIEADGDFKWW